MHECKTVTLRTRPLKGRMLSFYLDYYPGYRDKETMKVIRHETLGIYLYADPKNKREQNFNEVMTEKAEAIRCRRFESVVNERYDFFDKYKLKADFLEYFRSQLRKHDPKWEFVYLHFRNFVHGKHSLLSPEHTMFRDSKNGSNITSRSRLFAGQSEEASHPFPKPTSGIKSTKKGRSGGVLFKKAD